MITLFSIKINTRLKVDVGGMHRIMRLKNVSAIDEIVRTSIRIIKDESPEKIGVFKLSVKRLDEKTLRDSEGSIEKHIRIGPSIYYSKFVINATRGSDGRYVSQIDVRIRGGRHPGTKANPVIVRAKKRLRGPIRAIINKHYGNIEIGRFI